MQDLNFFPACNIPKIVWNSNANKIYYADTSRWIYVLLAFVNVNTEHCGYWMKTKVDCWILVNVEYWSWTWERQLLDSYSSISRRATTVPYVVDQSATKSEKGGVATIRRRWLLSFGRKKTKSFIDVSFDDLSNIRKRINEGLTITIWFQLSTNICYRQWKCVHKKLIKILNLATSVGCFLIIIAECFI